MTPPAVMHRLSLLLGLGMCFSILAACHADPQDTEAADAAHAARPNILLISIDDLNDWVGCLDGHPQTLTPNIDALAEEGVLFTRAYCNAPSCNPSRAATLTGVAPWRSGVYNNNPRWRAGLPDAVTLPRRFRDGGYYTAGAGKIFHHYQNDAASWDAYFPSAHYEFPPGSFSPPGYDSGYGDWEGRYHQFCWQPLDQRDEQSADYQNVAYIVGQLEALPTDRPFFLNCGIYRPHVPWFAPRKYFAPFPLDEVQRPAMRADDRDDLPPSAIEWLNRGRYYPALEEAGKHREAVQGYLASVHYMDAMVGLLLEALDASPHADNTLVVFWSDHGFHLGEKQWYRKYTLWDDACHVPLIIRLPPAMRSESAQPRRVDAAVSLLDLYPTLCELAGIDPGAEVDGRSLAPLLAGTAAPAGRVAVTVNDWATAYAVRTDTWCYIQRADGDELYHRDDVHQFDNLAGDPRYAEVIAELRRHVPIDPAPLLRRE